MADTGADRAHADGEDGTDSIPATNPATEHSVQIDEKIKKDFNISEFFQLASRVIDDGDAESMAAFMNLKRRWSEKFGEVDAFGDAGHGGFRRSRPSTFAAPMVARPARRFPRLLTPKQAELILQEMAAPRSKRQQTHGLGTVAPQPTRLEPPTAELGILHKPAARLEPPTMGVGSEVPDLQGTAAPLEPPKVDAGTKKSLAATASLTPRSAPTLGMAAHPSNGDLSLACPLTAALPSTCPLSNIALPAAAALNGSAPLNLVASSPRPMVAPRVPLMSPPFAMDVVGMGGFLSPPVTAILPTTPEARNPPRSWVAPPLTSTETAAAISLPVLGPTAVGITPATLPEISVFPPQIWAAPPQQPSAPVVLPLQPPISWPQLPPMPSIGSSPATSPLDIFIGNVPLKPCSDPFISDDKIAAAFHNSSRKTLTYIPPLVQNGEILVRPSIDMIREGSNRWNTTAVGYFLGKRPYFHHLNDFVRSIWPAVRDVEATSNGFFFFQFKTVAAMEEVLEGGPWLYLGQPIVLQKRSMHETGFFARVCVMLNVNSKLPKHIVIMMRNEHGGESACKVDVDLDLCEEKQTPAPALRTGDPIPYPDRFLNIPGLKTTWKEHQVAVQDLVSEFRLHFTALLETRVMPSNVCRVQTGLLPRWRWFVDYSGPVSARRELWQGLTELAMSADLPWLVGGDFNAVLDMSEVSGASGDIRVAMHEFNDCIIQTGLISLPMQGERFSWHNCSTDGRSLWKRLDRMFVNDAWLEQWPNLFYTYLTPRTSDHSPLVLKGDSRCTDSDGLVQTNPTTISSVFVTYFQDLLGGDRTDRALDLHYLRPWARHILKEEEACALIRPVTVDDVKTAMFDIEEDKAPGPDGFSSGFYKAAWPIVGKEISKAIMDFFTTGRLLKQVNATLLTLIPKCRLPPRCALKVDLRKAYDTVEWDFLFATLRLFGFPVVFIRWIEECVTSAYYSVVVNGGAHGFFAGAQGLRQGDPMSPCTELKLFQLSFADDLLLLCKADVRSVSLFRRGLDVFASLSGLHTNPQKSQLIFSKAASGLRDSLLETLGFQKATYLLGRVQLIKSVLVSLEVYWAMAFILPKGIINEMIKRLRTFLWKGTSTSGYPKVAWEVVCKPREEGGQGIKDIFALNRALMSKHLWAVIKQDRTSIWVDWIFQVRLRDCSIWTVKENKGAWGWRKMLTLRHTLLSHIHFRVEDGTSFLLWHDPWHPLGPLITRFPRGPQMTNTGPLDKISVVMEDRQWNWPMITDIACLEITYTLPPISEGQDRISWKSNNGSFNTSTAYDLFRPTGPKTVTAFCVWMESQRHITTFSLHAPFPTDVLPLSDSRYHFFGPTVTGNEEFTGRHPDGEESTWLMQHFDLYLPH
ncbi:hypothetical protein Sango_3063800 [Sesamum angolense]|uniref:Reverse transcriptase domain-containing protein n=1 Tax=Sesamum angolense TaxID=2727404 RepID=A0AAE1TA63_9LAMI|nr:hypothetical protein Sango_3063800 [Sesamum angolense]